MLTARAEYRLSLRTDTADDRFRARARGWGLIDERGPRRCLRRRAKLDAAISAFERDDRETKQH